MLAWALYASDYTRYLPVATRRARGSSGGRSSGCRWRAGWLEILGLLVADKATEGGAVDTINTILSGTPLAALAMLAIGIGTVAVNAMNDYTGSLSLQAAGIRVPRVVSALHRRGPRLPRDALAQRRRTSSARSRTSCCSSATGSRRGPRSSWPTGGCGGGRADVEPARRTSPGCRAACSGWRRRSSGSSCRCRSRHRRWAARSRRAPGLPINTIAATYLHYADLAYVVGFVVAFAVSSGSRSRRRTPESRRSSRPRSSLRRRSARSPRTDCRPIRASRGPGRSVCVAATRASIVRAGVGRP